MVCVQTQCFGRWTTKAHYAHELAARRRAIRILQECVVRQGDTRAVRVIRVPVR